MSRAEQLLQSAYTQQDAGRVEEATRLYEQVLALDPRNADAMHELGVLRVDAGRIDDGLALLRAAADARPTQFRFQSNLGMALRRAGKADESIPPHRAALRLSPDDPDTTFLLGNSLRDVGQLTEACDLLARAAALRPDQPPVLNTLGQAIQDQGKLDEAMGMYRRAIELRPGYAAAYGNTLLCMNYHERFSPQEVFDAHAAFGRRFASPAPLPPPRPSPAPDGRIRVGYLSPDFRQHSVAFFIWRILAKHDRARVNVTCFSDVAVPDMVTQHLQKFPERWRPVAGMSDEKLAQLIADDQIDILIDLAGHTGGSRMTLLASRKIAPVQATYLGYPNTTGLTTMDYRITDSVADPPGTTESQYTERLVRLPDAFFVYIKPGSDFQEVAATPALSRGHVTFGVFSNFPKVRPPMMQLWADLLAAVPNARLLMQTKAMGDPPTRDATLRFFTDRAIAAERIDLRGWLHFPQHVLMYHEADIVLDTFPFNGHTTTCLALWMGVPMVTLSGNTYRSRMSNSVLTNLALPELVAHSEAEYVRIAAELARDLPRLAQLRASMRQRMRDSVLLDDARFARNLEDAYEQMMRQSR